MPAWRLLALPSLQLGSLVAESWAMYQRRSPYPDVPPLEPSLRVVGEAVLDRSFTLGLNLLTGVPRPAAMRAAKQSIDAQVDFVRRRGFDENPAAYHRTPARVDSWELDRGRTWHARGREEFEHLRFESGYRPHDEEPFAEAWQAYGENRTSHAYVLRHEGRPRPWLVCIHGFGMGQPVANLGGFGAHWLHRELGLNVIMPVLPLHGPRAPGRVSGGEVLQVDHLRMVHLFAQAVFDVRRMLDWVRGQGGERIGLYGLSLGGYTSALVAAFESDLACVVAGIPAVDFACLARDNEPWLVKRVDDALRVDVETVRVATHVVSPLAYETRVAPEGRFIYAGLADRVAKPDQARALWRHWGRPPIHWYSGGHVAGQTSPGIRPFVEGALRKTLLSDQQLAQ